MVCRFTSVHTLFHVIQLHVDVLWGTAFASCIGCGFCQRYRRIKVVLQYWMGSAARCDGYLYVYEVIFGWWCGKVSFLCIFDVEEMKNSYFSVVGCTRVSSFGSSRFLLPFHCLLQCVSIDYANVLSKTGTLTKLVGNKDRNKPM